MTHLINFATAFIVGVGFMTGIFVALNVLEAIEGFYRERRDK